MMEQGRFVKLLAELLELAAVKDNRIVKAEVDQWFEELSLNREQLALVYRYLEENQVRISGLEKADRLWYNMDNGREKWRKGDERYVYADVCRTDQTAP